MLFDKREEYFINAKMYYHYFNAIYEKTRNEFYPDDKPYNEFYLDASMHFYAIAKKYGTILCKDSLELTDSEKEMVNKLLTCNS